jgi:glyoxylase-like metal-dependent hydrolase (beta-lactamase superfamily II)
MRPLDGDHVIAPGLTAVDLGGHTPGSQGVLVETARGRCLIAGDAVPTYENLRDDVPTGWYVDLRRTHATMRRIRELQAVVLPSHDPAVLDAEVVTR